MGPPRSSCWRRLSGAACGCGASSGSSLPCTASSSTEPERRRARIGGRRSPLRKVWAVVRREFLERVRNKWFVIATVLGPVFVIAITVLPSLFLMGGSQRRPGGWGLSFLPPPLPPPPLFSLTY